MEPKVSCLLSAYYGADFLKRRMDNLLSQRGVEFEILVACAEGSREQEILQEYDYESIILLQVTEDVPTLYATWNELISVASGEYFTNTNSDDILYPGALEFLAEALDKNPKEDIVYANSDIINKVNGDPVNRHLWPQGTFFDLVHGCFIGPMPMWRKSLHSKYGLFDAEMFSSGDYEFWLRVTKEGAGMLHLERVIGAYLARQGLEKKYPVLTVIETARARSRYVDWKTLYDDVNAKTQAPV